MFNPNQFGNDNGEMDQDAIPEPFDYLEHAKRLREEREAIEATRKAEREAKDLEKKAEKAERVAKKIAEKATEDLEKKADKVAEKTGDAKELITEARDEVAELKERLYDSAHDAMLPAPIETVVMSDGSEISSELEKGEQMIMEIQHSTDKLVETVTLADEVTAQADALAKARAALDSVDAEAMGVSYSGQEDNSQVFGESGPQEDIRDRLRHAWELPRVSPNAGQDLVSADMNVPTDTELVSFNRDNISYADNSEYQAVSADTTNSSYGGGEVLTSPAVQSSGYEQSVAQTKEDVTDPTAKVSSGVKTGLAFAAGLFANKSHSTNNSLKSTESALRSQTTDLSREIQAAASQPVAMYETKVSSPAQHPNSVNSLPRPDVRLSGTKEQSTAKAEIRGTNEPAIPDWIKQVEKDVQKGRVVELKKWQIDVLRTQHPDLLKRYDKLDRTHEQQIKTQSFETIRAEQQFDRRPLTVSAPGDLPPPIFDASMPAFMRPKVPSAQPIPMTVPTVNTQAYEYAMRDTSSNAILGNSYITNVMIGGLLLGALLIGVFGF